MKAKKMKRIYCPYCGAQAKLRPASVVYKENTIVHDAFLYVCDRYPRCDAYVSAHRDTKRPMGTLANSELRNKRIRAHKVFDRVWKSGLMTKWQAYKWLQATFGLDEDEAHIAMFSEYMCERLIRECTQISGKQDLAS